MVSELEGKIENLRFPKEQLPDVFADSNRVWKTPVARGYSYVYEALELAQRDSKTWRGSSILDVGCGDNYDDPARYFPGAFVTGIDPKVNCPDSHVENTAHYLLKGVVQRLPVEADSYNFIYSSWSFPYHIPERYHNIGIFELLRTLSLSGEIFLLPRGSNTLSDSLVEGLENSGFIVEYLQSYRDSYTRITFDPYIDTYTKKYSALLEYAQYVDLHQRVINTSCAMPTSRY